MLNPEQIAAVKYIEGPLLVLAGAGSGKTSVITQKIAYLIRECGYKARNICAVTFTNKAATEMKKRVGLVLPAPIRRGLQVGTFHALGLTILKPNAARCGLSLRFSIFDSDDCAQIISGLLPAAVARDREKLQAMQQQISRWKNDMLTPDMVRSLYCDNQQSLEASEIYPRYQQLLQSYNAVDFDDLIRLPVYLFKQFPEILAQWQQRMSHLLVDEYQDSNVCQYELVKCLVGSRARFTVVGDDDQSVYAWRGARPENLAQLQHDYPHLKLIKLEQNYRSTGRILHAANKLIGNNKHLFQKTLWSELGHGDMLRVLSCKNETDEAEQVVGDLISHKLRHQTSFGDYAILYRGNHQARVFEKLLRLQSISYHVSGGQSWFARAEIKDIFAYLKLLCNESDDAAFLRIVNTPARGIGNTSIDALARHALMRQQSLFMCCDDLALTESIAEKPRLALLRFKEWMLGLRQRCISSAVTPAVLRSMIDECGYEAYIYEQSDTTVKAQKRMENVWELVDWIERLLQKDDTSSLSDVINKLILIDVLEKSDAPDLETLQLMTLHASKGLEFPYVYLVGMEEGLLPHRVSIEDEQIDEERRLAYVGITRARKGLCLTLARQRRSRGEMQECLPSRFLEELPEEVLEWYGKSCERDEEKSKILANTHLMGLRNLLA